MIIESIEKPKELENFNDDFYKKSVLHVDCGEIFMQPYDACRLIAVNLFSFVDDPFTINAKFNFEKFFEINYKAMRIADAVIDLELEYIERIINKIKNDPEPIEERQRELDLWLKVQDTAAKSRRAGLGFTALGDTLAALNLKYDSDEAFEVVDNIMYTKMKSELACTNDLAKLRGAFDGWDYDLEFERNLNPDCNCEYYEGKNRFYDFIAKTYEDYVEDLYEYGRRNVSWSTVAPTGTVSLLAQVTSGIEPLFMPFYMRRKKINTNDENARVDFVDDSGDSWQEFAVLHPKFAEWIVAVGFVSKEALQKHLTGEKTIDKKFLDEFFDKSPWKNSTAPDINWVKRVELQSIIQKYISHSISSTINLPEDVTLDEVSEIYLEGWRKGLKGLTVYRDGSRSGVLVADTEKKEDESHFSQNNAMKRPKVVNCRIHQSTTKGQEWLVVIGFVEEKPYEVFCTKNDFGFAAGTYEGTMTKHKSGHYSLNIADGKYIIDKFTSIMSDEQQALTRLISGSLRHGMHIKFIVEQLQKTEGSLNSFNRSIARILKKYIADGEKSTLKCFDCGGSNVIFEEGCNKCLDCGSSACG